MSSAGPTELRRREAPTRLILALLTAVFLSAQSPPPELQQFNDALRRQHWREASAVLDRVLEQRIPADGKPRPDSVVNALIGRLTLAGHEAGPAAIYLSRAPLDALPAAMRGETAFAYGQALEWRGDRSAASQAYRAAAAQPGSASLRRRATLAAAAQLLATDPTAVRGEVAVIANAAAAPDRWQAHYLLAAASSLLGDGAAAARFAYQAWADAASAPAADLAPLHVATLRAGLAAAVGNQATEQAMLTATNGLTLSASPALGAQLPVCGDNGLQPADYVIFGIVAGPYNVRRLFPIAASRPQVVAAFQDRLGGVAMLKTGRHPPPVGTVVRLSCRTTVSPNYLPDRALPDPMHEWFVDRGLYPATSTNDDDKNINTVATRIQMLGQRFGTDSPLLLMPRWQLLMLLEARARSGDAVPTGELTDLAGAIAGGMKRLAAPEWLVSVVEKRAQYNRLLAGAADESARAAVFQQIFRTELESWPFAFARPFAVAEAAKFTDNLPAPLASIIIDLDRRAPRSTDRQDRQAWLLTVSKAQSALGMEREAAANRASAGFGPDLCIVAETLPRLLEQHFSYKDYPQELTAAGQEGQVLFEFGLTAAGSITAPRTLISLPVGVFDAVSKKGMETVRYTPARRDGKAVPCHGLTQPVVWRLEQESDSWTPTLTPPAEDETT